MKSGIQNYGLIMPIETSCIKFNNNKLNVYKDLTLHKVTEFHTEWFSVYPNITSKCLTIGIFKILFKNNKR
jgi:hypothetical protein